MNIEKFVISPLQSNCYVVSEGVDPGSPAVIIDPGDTALDPVFSYIDDHELRVQAIWCTHGHLDHVLGANYARQRYPVPAYLHHSGLSTWQQAHQQAKTWLGLEAEPLEKPERFWSDNDSIQLGNIQFTVWHTPGHSPGGVCIIGDNVAFTGDTLFAGTIGRTDFPESDLGDMNDSLRRLLELPDTMQLYPGHMQATSMAAERRANPFLAGL